MLLDMRCEICDVRCEIWDVIQHRDAEAQRARGDRYTICDMRYAICDVRCEI